MHNKEMLAYAGSGLLTAILFFWLAPQWWQAVLGIVLVVAAMRVLVSATREACSKNMSS